MSGRLLTFGEASRRRYRRERLIRYGVALAAVAFPCLLAYVVIGWVLESL